MPDLRFPGTFDSFFSGTAVAQGEANTGYPGAATVKRAYDTSSISALRSGRMISRILTFDVSGQELADALDCVEAYAAVCIDSARAGRGAISYTVDPMAYNEFSREIQAAERLMERITRLRDEVAVDA